MGNARGTLAITVYIPPGSPFSCRGKKEQSGIKGRGKTRSWNHVFLLIIVFQMKTHDGNIVLDKTQGRE